MDLRCKKCNRWLGRIDKDVSGLTVKCGNCKHNNIYTVKFIGHYDSYSCYSINRTMSSISNGQAKTAEQDTSRGKDNE